ncbi:MAG: FtsX-like permease family protein [Pseudomonadota bacterium]
MKKTLRLATRLLKRDWRLGELKIVIAAVVIAVTSITTIGFVVERVEYSMERQSSSLLGGDRRVTSRSPLNPTLEQEALTRGLSVSPYLGMATMAVKDDNFQLISLRSIQNNYPLRGTFKLSEEPFGLTEEKIGAPKSGHIWVTPKLLQLMNVDVGDFIQLGFKNFQITKLIIDEPGNVSEVFNVAPSVYISSEDLAATQLVQPGSRVNYHLLVAGPSQDVEDYTRWLETNLTSAERVQGGRESSEALGSAFERADNYLNLAAIVSVLLAGVAIAMATQRYARRHYDYVAMFRCLGAQQNEMIQLYLITLTTLAIIGSSAGVVIAFGLHELIFVVLKQFFAFEVDYIVLKPAILGLLTGVVMVLGFSIPSIINLSQVSPLRVLRRELLPPSLSSWLIYSSSILAITFLLLWYTKNLLLVLLVISVGGLVSIGIMWMSARMITLVARSYPAKNAQFRFGLNQLERFKHINRVQVTALAVAILVTLVVLHVRTDLIREWQGKIPDDAPNYFIVNIQPQDLDAVNQFFSQTRLVEQPLYPMVRGRLSHINGEAVEELFAEQPNQHNALRRELNLSWGGSLVSSNKIVKGNWHQGQDQGISIEAEMAQALGINLGDTVAFNVAGTTISREVTSLREVAWDSFQPNFYVIFGEGVLDNFPKNYITSVYLSGNYQALLTEFIKTFPTVTLIDIEPIMNQVRTILSQVTIAIEFIFSFTFIAGLLVLVASLLSTMDERKLNSVIIRTLGADRFFLKRSLTIEFYLIGIIGGLLGAVGTELIGGALSIWAFQITPSLHPWLWGLGPVMGIISTVIASQYLAGRIVNQAPLTVLRELNN